MDRAGFQAWLDRYVEAWRTYDPETIASLFTEDARYSYHPYDEDVVGKDAIVKDWLQDPDTAGSWEARYEPWALEGDRGVAIGRSRYLEGFGQQPTEYANVYLVTFAEDGRAREFREYFMEAREGFRKRRQEEIAEAVEQARSEWQQQSERATLAGELAETKVQG
ncbi:MAG: nuclear transport factor 2 family protein [Chloroflexi bacterium]|nr:nuclear transport factor 2 family protein [Chloroflexota bacterium]